MLLEYYQDEGIGRMKRRLKDIRSRAKVLSYTTTAREVP
jgi:hypothetical protein